MDELTSLLCTRAALSAVEQNEKSNQGCQQKAEVHIRFSVVVYSLHKAFAGFREEGVTSVQWFGGFHMGRNASFRMSKLC